MNRQPFVWMLCLMAGVFLVACAGQHPGRQIPDQQIPDRQTTDPSQTSSSENLPQIGAPQASISREAPRRDIITRLTKKAENQIRSNELFSAFATLERAVDMDPRDPFVWHLMARVQLLQGNLYQAQAFAKKSNLLAGGYPSLREKNQEIIARAMGTEGSIPGE